MPEPRGLLFLSHSSQDKILADQFGKFLRSVSLGQIAIWFSSDAGHSGGIQPGDLWFDKIREKMHSSTAIITLLTPNSVSSKWIFFESGAVMTLSDRKLIVITHNIASMADIPPPLTFWQAHRIDRTDDLREFCEKLFDLYEVQFESLLFNSYSKAFLKSTTKAVKELSAESAPDGNDITVSRLIKHFDKRFFELTSSLQIKSTYLSYNIVIMSDFDNRTYVVEITERMMVQDVLDEVYECLQSFVEPHKYLDQWILIHGETNLRVVIREFASGIAGTALFKPDSRWVAKKLDAPYSGTDYDPEVQRLETGKFGDA
jgi:hypothetical protein